MRETLLLGQTISFAANPFQEGIAAARHESDGAVLLRGGKIARTGRRADLLAAHPDAERHDFGQSLISAGFVDCHMHYPQTGIIASFGKRLIDWLNQYTFPEEMKFGDIAYARAAAALSLDLALLNGTTTLASYGTIHPESVDAFFTEANLRRMRVAAGKTCMDRNAPDGLRDTAQSAYDDSKRLLQQWQGKGRIDYILTPRFSPTSSEAQLAALGALWAEFPQVLMQTHLSEQTDEVAWVKSLYPSARDYLDTYERHGLLGPRGIYGHAIWLTPREKDRLREVGAALAHCPTSNTFIGSGLFDMALAVTHVVGLATDTGGGTSFSMLRTMAAAYEIGQLKGQVLHASLLWYLATAGSARALHLSDRIGNLGEGMEADIVVVDLASTPMIAQRAKRAQDFWESLFATVMMGDDRAISAVYVAGEKVAHRQRFAAA